MYCRWFRRVFIDVLKAKLTILCIATVDGWKIQHLLEHVISFCFSSDIEPRTNEYCTQKTMWNQQRANEETNTCKSELWSCSKWLARLDEDQELTLVFRNAEQRNKHHSLGRPSTSSACLSIVNNECT